MSTPAEAPELDAVLAELSAMADAKALAINRRHGDDHAVNLTALRALAKRLKTQHRLAVELWRTGDSAAKLLALLIARPREFGADELDAMMRQANTPKVHDWLVNYAVAKSPHAEQLRSAWLVDDDPSVAAAGWALTAGRVAKHATDLDAAALLDRIEEELADAPERLQWAMNTTPAQIGIADAELRPRAVAIGERLGVLKDYPTSPGCTSPYAPTWIAEMVARREAG